MRAVLDEKTRWRKLLEDLHASRARSFRLKLPTPAIVIAEAMPAGRLADYDHGRNVIRIDGNLFREHGWPIVEGVFLHEMAHQLQFTLAGGRADAAIHGPDFAAACERVGVPHEFRVPFVSIGEISDRMTAMRRAEGDDPVLRRVEKLQALIANPGTLEEQAAAVRLLEGILRKHNVEALREALPIGRWLVATGKTHGTIERKVASLVSRLAPVRFLYFRAPRLVDGGHECVLEFWGRREHLAYAEYLYGCLRGFLEAHKAPRGVNPLTWKGNLLREIAARLAPLENEALASDSATKALVVAHEKAIEQEWKRFNPRIRTTAAYAPKRLAGHHAHEAKRKAAAFVLRKPVDKPRGRTLLLKSGV